MAWVRRPESHANLKVGGVGILGGVSQAMVPELEAVIARIEVPRPVVFTPPPGVTGELARLLRWWTSVSDGSAPQGTALVSNPGDAGVALAVLAGVAAADRACDEGATLLLTRIGTRRPVAALAVIGALTRTESSAITFQSTGMTDREWIDRCAAVRDACVDIADLRASPVELLDVLAAPDIAFLVGVLLAAAARRTPCIVDGTDELAAALVADRLSFRAKEWWRAGSSSPDPARQAAVDRLAVDEGLPLALNDDEGLGADATVALLRMLAAEAD